MKDLKISKAITNRDSVTVKAYLRDISKYERLSAEREAELAELIRQGDSSARDELVNANLLFVVSVAKQYHTSQGLPLMDLISEGNIGLIKAAERFDEKRGFKFISYAVNWIRQSILQAINNQERMIRLPLNKLTEMNRIFSFIAEYEQNNGQKPSDAEISANLHIPEKRIAQIIALSSRHSSIDDSLKEGEKGTLLDVIPATDLGGLDKKMDKSSLQIDITRVIKQLKPKEREVILSFYGIGRAQQSLDEIGDNIGLSPERCRQLRDRATRTLKAMPQASILRSYL